MRLWNAGIIIPIFVITWENLPSTRPNPGRSTHTHSLAGQQGQNELGMKKE